MPETKYYRILNAQCNGHDGVFNIALLPDCEVYKGHFPGNPVSPGVCNILMIKELAESMAERKLFIKTIRRCRFTNVITPAACPELYVKINLADTAGGYEIIASVYDNERAYLELKGELTA
ncbi:MAG: beta-hydroxyacyl-ACP dehydratase [Prevotella sp.]|nr:beta-hydroxyacyl-ACP dehydratase [Prevotella sp.]